MYKKIKENKYQILELIIIFIITLLFNLICISISGDEVWNYGFSYNIATGLIPYKDFNMVITPLFPMIGAIFLNIFGKSLLTYHIFNAIICTTIFYNLKKNVNKSYYLIYIIIMPQLYPSYNIFCLLLLYILMGLENNKKNDYLVGIILGLTFLTKQSIGLFLCIPTLFTKDIKRMFKRGIGFLIPNLIMLVYLLINDCLYKFIDYTILGLSSFAKENSTPNIVSIIIVMIAIIYLICNYIKKKDIKIIYLICFQLLVFPLAETYHVIIAITPTLGYLANTLKINKKLAVYAFIIFIITSFSVNTYHIYKGNIVFPNVTEKFTYRPMHPNSAQAVKNVADYASTIEDELYIIYRNAYTIKLEANIPINKYDLLIPGNLGKGGEKQIIKEIEDNCSDKKCVFLVNMNELSLENVVMYGKETTNYIMNNYTLIDSVEAFAVYTNHEYLILK